MLNFGRVNGVIIITLVGFASSMLGKSKKTNLPNGGAKW